MAMSAIIGFRNRSPKNSVLPAKWLKARPPLLKRLLSHARFELSVPLAELLLLILCDIVSLSTTHSTGTTWHDLERPRLTFNPGFVRIKELFPEVGVKTWQAMEPFTSKTGETDFHFDRIFYFHRGINLTWDEEKRKKLNSFKGCL